MLQIKNLPPRWHIINKDGQCCDGLCKKNKLSSSATELAQEDEDQEQQEDHTSGESRAALTESTNSSSSETSNGNGVNSNAGGDIRSSSASFELGSDEDDDNMRGPLDISNWVVKNKILTGEYPGNIQNEIHQTNLRTLLDAGITVFVCLQESGELSNFRDYKEDCLLLAKERGIEEEVEFLHFPIEDGGVASSLDSLNEFIDILLSKLQDDKKIYLHCILGRGRSGILASCLLGRLYSVSGLEALRRTQTCYEQRIVGIGESPEYHPQRMQVIKYLKYIGEKNEL